MKGPPPELIRRQQTLDFAHKIFARGVKYSFYCYLAYNARYAIEALAGNQTSIDLLVRWFSNDAAAKIIGYIFGVCGVGYGLLERREKRRKTIKLTRRIRMLEEMVDPDRSSSSLAPDGQTNPRDGA